MPKTTTKKTKKFRSLTFVLSTAFLLLNALLLLISSSLNMYTNFHNQRDIIGRMQLTIAEKATDMVRNFIHEKFNILRVASSIGELAIAPPKEQKTILEKSLGIEPAFRQLVLLNLKNEQVIKIARQSNLAAHQITEEEKSRISSKVSKNEEYISPVYIDEVTSEPLLIMAVPVNDVFGDFNGTLLAEVNLKFMWDLVGNIRVGNTGLAYVVDKDGNLIAFDDISRVLKRENLKHLKEVADFVAMPEEHPIDDHATDVAEGIQGIRVVAKHVHLGTPDWAIVVEMPVKEAYKPVVTAFRISILIMALIFILAIIAGAYLSKRITEPIIRLRDAAVKLGEGKLNTQIEIESRSEIGQLAASFNQMVNDLQKSTVSIAVLKEEQQRFQDVAASTGDWIWEVDSQGRYIYSSIMVKKILGYDPEELIGKYFYDFFQPDEREELKQAALEAFSRKENIRDFLNKNIRKDGKIVILETSCVPLVENGKLIGYRGADRDVTERKIAEEEYRTILDTTNDGFWIVDIQGNFLDVNDAYCRLIGYSRQELLEMNISDIEQKENLENIALHINRIMEIGGDRFETCHLCKDSTIIDIEVSVTYTPELGERLYVFLRDITERKRAEIELKSAYEKLKSTQVQLIHSEKMAGIGQLAAGVAHEINNPTAYVMSNLETLKNYTRATSNVYNELEDFISLNLSYDQEKARHHQELINEIKKKSQIDYIIKDMPELIDESLEGTRKIKTIVSNLKTFAHPDTEESKLTSMNEELEKSLTLVWNELKYNCEVIRDYDNNLPLVNANPGQMNQVFVNLLINASQSIDQNGTITIRTYSKEKNVYVEISDTGCGIPQEIRSRIFDPFFTSKPVGSGTGLGLSLVYNIIKNHNGNISVKSKVGEGSTFTVKLTLPEKDTITI